MPEILALGKQKLENRDFGAGLWFIEFKVSLKYSETLSLETEEWRLGVEGCGADSLLLCRRCP